MARFMRGIPAKDESNASLSSRGTTYTIARVPGETNISMTLYHLEPGAFEAFAAACFGEPYEMSPYPYPKEGEPPPLFP